MFDEIDDDVLNKLHDDYAQLRASIADKWYERTKIGTIPKKGYTALEIPTWQLIQNALKDKHKLIQRTQIDRTNDVDTNDCNAETFNEDDFYHIQLRDIVNKDESRRWVELQRTRYKSKRKADTKATKGRKIKKDPIPKLVNFMAPMRPANQRNREPLPEQIRLEMLKSLFGGSVRHKP